ncbi:transcriptional regulator [Haloechinothrix salitolerans]|uniref:Transcriptional regulator n=1 Tax=Haloechinothrix salitolerans TaxID=926830 RepID=A0ABW2BYT2_9PSEU
MESEEGSDRLHRALRDPSRVDLVAVAHLRQRVQDLEWRYDTVPSTALLAEAGHVHAQVDTLAKHAVGRIAKEMRLVQAEAATLLGQLTWDASQRRDHRTALKYLERAEAAARDIGDPTAQGYALLRRAYVALYGQHDPGTGLALTRRAGELVDGISAVLTGLTHLHAAEANAMLGNTGACETALSSAETQFGRISPSDIAAHLYSPGQFDRLAGSCYLSLGDHVRAQRILGQAARTQQRSPSKSGALVFANLSLTHLHQRDIEAATTALHRALDIAETTRGGGGLNLVARVGRELSPWRTNPIVEPAYDRLLSLLTAA